MIANTIGLITSLGEADGLMIITSFGDTHFDPGQWLSLIRTCPFFRPTAEKFGPSGVSGIL